MFLNEIDDSGYIISRVSNDGEDIQAMFVSYGDAEILVDKLTAALQDKQHRDDEIVIANERWLRENS